MTIQAINSINSIQFQGKTKKTISGNEYKTTHKARTTLGAVGLLSGALGAKIASNKLKTLSGKKTLINALENMGKKLSDFGPVGGDKTKIISKGILGLGVGIAAVGMLIGATIGGAVDSHYNNKRAKAADKNAIV